MAFIISGTCPIMAEYYDTRYGQPFTIHNLNVSVPNQEMIGNSQLKANGSFIEYIVGAVLLGAITGTAFGIFNKAIYEQFKKNKYLSPISKLLCWIGNPYLLARVLICVAQDIPAHSLRSGFFTLCLTAITMDRLIYYDKIRLPFDNQPSPKDTITLTPQQTQS